MIETETLTHRRHSPELSKGDIILFAAGEGNWGYGPHVWTLQTDLPKISDELIKWTAEYYDIDLDEAEELVDPSDIVDSAGAWDDRQFVSDLWAAIEFGRIKEVAGYRTQNGAVVFDRTAVELTYEFED